MIAALILAWGFVDELGKPDPASELATGATRPAVPSSSIVVYEVEGSVAWADVTMQTPTGTSQISPDVPLMTKAGARGLTFEFPPGAFVYLAAQMKGERGTIRCRIRVDGEVVSENFSNSAYGIASCKSRT